MDFRAKAVECRPEIFECEVQPVSAVTIAPEAKALHGYLVQPLDSAAAVLENEYGAGESFTLDFGTHCVGYLNVRITCERADSPLRLRFIFAEMPVEIGRRDEIITEGLSSTWRQEEIINLDFVPCSVRLPRRYAFRYVYIEILGTVSYKVRFERMFCTNVTSADVSKLQPLPAMTDSDIVAIDAVAARTLKNCMQDVFEDGPKRDRRLWMGDLRLEALANYQSYDNTALVRRCLCLFAALTHEDGQVSSCVYTVPKMKNDPWRLLDYSLLYISVLYDYYKHTKDIDLLRELFPTALRQTEIAYALADSNGIIRENGCFIDWCAGLDKTVALQGVAIYTFKQCAELSVVLGELETSRELRSRVEKLTTAAMKHMFDAERGVFVSPDSGDAAPASQVWMALAKVLTDEENAELMDKLDALDDRFPMRTPYMYHHYIQALINCGQSLKAMGKCAKYWGKMVTLGADCFWESFDPNEPGSTFCGNNLTASYCHGWSSTPLYFIRKYFSSIK